MPIAFQSEPFGRVWPQARPLIQRHWEEVVPQGIRARPDINEQLYRGIEDAGMLHITTARQRGQLVGYAVYFLTPDPHFSQGITAQSDAFYLLPEHRKGLAGMRLLQAAEAALAGRGATRISQQASAVLDCGVLLRRMGYVPTQQIYVKEVC